MMIVVMICLGIRYFYWKYIFVRFCRVPNIYNQILNDRVLTILKYILLLRSMISLYMYGADDVFAMEKSAFMEWVIYIFMLGCFLRCRILQINFYYSFEGIFNMVLYYLCTRFLNWFDISKFYCLKNKKMCQECKKIKTNHQFKCK